MSSDIREEFSSEASPEVLAALRRIAASDGKEFKAVVDEALRDYVERRAQRRPRPHVVSGLAESVKQFDELYRELAK